MKIDTSFIIVTYNTKNVTLNCIKSIYENGGIYNFEIICVDNASVDGSKESITKMYPKVRYHYSYTNLGFGRANNLASKLARGMFLLFLNSDTIIEDKQLVSETIKLLNESTTGICSTKIVFNDGSTQTIGERFPDLKNILCNKLFLGDTKYFKKFFTRSNTKQIIDVDWVTGAYFGIRKELFIEVTGFDEEIFLNAEDIDLCARIKNAGYNILVNQSVTIKHLHAVSKRKANHGFLFKDNMNSINSLVYVIKKNRISKFPNLIKFILLLRATLQILFTRIFKTRFSNDLQ